MKKILLSLTSFSLITSSVTAIIACEPVQQFPSMSANISDDILNRLFADNKISLFYPEYLHFINGFFEHNDFEGSLTINKSSSPFIEESSDWSASEREYYDALRQIYNPSLIDNQLDFTGLTYIVENIFIDEVKFEEGSNSNLIASLSTTMAITVLKGWKIVGKLLLNVEHLNPISPFLTNKFLNTWINAVLNYKIIFNEVENYFIIHSGQSVEQIIFQLISRNNQLSELSLSENDFVINKENNGFIFNGFEYLIQPI